ncbi:MFS transporter, partial [Microbacteriaceae bacterium K1510]|nr:MFS transporter [Microbacteriaceae bacterium K1510]
LVMIGALLMGVSSIVGYFSHQFILLMLARIAQSLGAAVFPGVGLVLFSRYIPVVRRGRAMSAIASSGALGFGMGPVVGGALTQYLGWNVLFVVTGMILILLPLLQ